MENGTDTVGDSLAVTYKTTHTVLSSYHTSSYLPKEVENIPTQKSVHGCL